MFKVNVGLTLLLEKNRTSKADGFHMINDEHYVKYELSIPSDRMTNTIPFRFNLIERKRDTQKYTDYLNMYNRDMLDKNVDASSTKYIGITGISFYVDRLKGTGAKSQSVDFYKKNQQLYACTSTTNLCVIECIYIARFSQEYKNLKGCKKSIVARVKEQYRDLFNQNPPKDLVSLDLYNTLTTASEKYNIEFIIYSFDGEKYEQDFIIDKAKENRKIVSLLLVSVLDFDPNHLMFIKDVQTLTKLHICPKCGYCPPASQNNNYNKDRFETHVKYCTGKRQTHLKLMECSILYVPPIFKNRMFAYLYA
jgi:hypothetical protein